MSITSSRKSCRNGTDIHVHVPIHVFTICDRIRLCKTPYLNAQDSKMCVHVPQSAMLYMYVGGFMGGAAAAMTQK